MSSIVGAITGSNGSKGMGFEAGNANIFQPVSRAQVEQSYENSQTGLKQQQDFLNAVNAQNGLGNQASVFQQQQGVANGTGPNPAQAMLANSTGQNVAAQNAMMAGQRGAGANAGLIARQASMQGANIQQQAAGQGAALQAQQSLGALNQMGSIATNQANQQANATNAYSNSALNQQQNLLGGAGAYNNAQVAMHSNMNNANAAIQGGVAGQQGNMFGNLMGGMGGAMNLFGGMMGGGGGDAATMAGGAGDAMGSMGGASDVMSAGDGLTMLAAEGGQVPQHYDQGGMIANSTTPLASVSPQAPGGPQSFIGQDFMQQQNAMKPEVAPVPVLKGGGGAGPAKGASSEDMGAQAGGMFNMGHNLVSGDNAKARTDGDAGVQWDWGNSAKGAARGAQVGSFFPVIGTAIGGIAGGLLGGLSYEAEGGEVKAMLSPGEKYLDPSDVSKVKQGANPLAVGKDIPGKPKVGGAKNDYANDTVPATLQSGGIVLPRSVTQSKDPAKSAADFVAAIMQRQSLKKGK